MEEGHENQLKFRGKGGRAVLSSAMIVLAAWLAGLFADANIPIEPLGFLCLRVVLPVLAMGLCLLWRLGREGRA